MEAAECELVSNAPPGNPEAIVPANPALLADQRECDAVGALLMWAYRCRDIPLGSLLHKGVPIGGAHFLKHLVQS